MGSKRDLNNSRTTIISIIILDLILMTLFLFFSDLILRDFQNSESSSIIAISSFAIVVPGTLIILIIFQFYKLYKNKFHPGNNLKKNIVTFFILTTLLAVIPQSFISINFINTATENWLNKQVQKSIDLGLNLAIDTYNEKVNNLEELSSSDIFINILKDIYIKKDTDIREITKINSNISSIEYFNTSGNTLYHLGPENLQMTDISLGKTSLFYPKTMINSSEVISYQFPISINRSPFIIILRTILPKDFTKNGALLTQVKGSLAQINPNKKTLSLGMFIYYSFFSIPLFLLGVLGCFIFAEEVVKPIKNIEEAIRSVAQGNYSYRILSKKKNEFNILISSFNNMIKEIEKSRNKLKHTEQISTWQDIATRLAHEIRNPLTPIKLSAQRVLIKEEKNKTTKKYMETIINEVVRMEKLLTEFRDFARFPSLNLEKAFIKDTINEGIRIYKDSYPNIIFNLDSVENIELSIDKNQIIQVISNLTINGIHAMDKSGTIEYFSETVMKRGIEYCRIGIKDSGHGIPEDLLPNILKPYFTTKYDGSGLGLAIVNKIILDHKGKLWVESAENIGTTFYFELPKEII